MITASFLLYLHAKSNTPTFSEYNCFCAVCIVISVLFSFCLIFSFFSPCTKEGGNYPSLLPGFQRVDRKKGRERYEQQA